MPNPRPAHAVPRSRAPVGLLALLGVVAATSACREQAQSFGARKDAAVEEALTCNSTADCGGRGVCVSGVCEAVTSCMTDDQCAGEGKVCHSRRFYCVECDGTHPDECPPGETCQFDFTCVGIGSGPADAGAGATCSGSCADRSSCPDDKVCKNGACCTPPSRCFSPADCPTSRPECNGATGLCFGGESCGADRDCESRAGCAGGACVCDPGSLTCRVRPDECQSDDDCRDPQTGAYAGKFCTITMPPKRCVGAPSCSSDSDCSAVGLVCDLEGGSPSRNKCRNGRPCQSMSDCGSASETCVSGTCQRRNCLNTPGLCGAGQSCDPATGTCTTDQGGSCTIDTQCPADRYCDTARGTCALGCRDTISCGGQVCDANHQCTGGVGQVCGTCATDAECPAGTRCRIGMCYEPCSTILMIGCSLRPNAQCVLGNCSCIIQ